MADLVDSVNRALTEIDSFLLTSLSIFDDLPIGATVLNARGEFTRVNQTFASYLGCSREEIEGRVFLDFVHPDYREQHLEIAERLAAWITAGKPASGPLLPEKVINEYRRKDGTYVKLVWLRPRREGAALPTGLHIGFCVRAEEVCDV